MSGKQSKGASEEKLNAATKNAESSSPKTGLDIDRFTQIPDALIRDIGRNWLTRKDAITAEKAVRVHHGKIGGAPTTLFKPMLNETDAAYAILKGSCEHLIQILTKESHALGATDKTSVFFQKCVSVTDPAGQIFYSVSPAELIDMVSDVDMLQQVAHFVETLPIDKRQRFLNDWKTQRASRGLGGADLLKVTSDPMTMSFDELLERTQLYDLVGGACSATFPLLQNPDGLIYYNDNSHVRWYYVNKDARTVRAIHVDASMNKDAYNVFKASMDNMESMSARRSSNDEHKLIKSIMRDTEYHKPIQLVRQGHEYVRKEIPLSRVLSRFNREEFLLLRNQFDEEYDDDLVLIKHATQDDYQEQFFSYAELCALLEKWPKEFDDLRAKLLIPNAIDVRYCDTQYDFNRYYNAYRKCLRLYSSDNGNNDWLIAANIWEKELGNIQKEIMWLLQRYCDETLNFYHLPEQYKEQPFLRSLRVEKIVNIGWQRVDIYDRNLGHFDEGFGSSFAIYKAGHRGGGRPNVGGKGSSDYARCGGGWPWRGPHGGSYDLAQDLADVLRLVSDAKAKVDSFRPDENFPPNSQPMPS